MEPRTDQRPDPSSGSRSIGSRTILPCGDSAFLVELPDLPSVVALYRGLMAGGGLTGGDGPGPRGGKPTGIVDIVPAARTLLVTFDFEVVSQSEVRSWLAQAEPDPAGFATGREVTIEVSYGGPDLSEVAQYLGQPETEVVALHTGSSWTAAFSGFAPGFAYLVTDHDKLRVPRRNTPRTVVPSGSVGLAGEFSGIYPRSSPGGWQLIGTTTATLWDASKPEPALIRPGDKVRFVEA